MLPVSIAAAMGIVIPLREAFAPGRFYQATASGRLPEGSARA